MGSETIRLFDLASQLNKGSDALLALAHSLGLPVKSKMSKLSEEQVASLREAIERDLHALPQAARGSIPVAGEQAQDVASKAEAADQAKEFAWMARIEKIRAELQAANPSPAEGGSENNP